MKRLFIAAALLGIIIVLNILSEKAVSGYCSNMKTELYKAVGMLEEKDYDGAYEIVRDAMRDRSPIPYIYNLDFKKINRELADAENLIKMKKDEYASICILRSISLTDDIYCEYSFFRNANY